MTLKIKIHNIDYFAPGDRIVKLKPFIYRRSEDHICMGIDRHLIYEKIQDNKIIIVDKAHPHNYTYKLDYLDFRESWAKYVDPWLLKFLEDKSYVENFLRHPNFDKFKKEWSQYVDPKIIETLNDYGLSNKNSIDEFLENFE